MEAPGHKVSAAIATAATPLPVFTQTSFCTHESMRQSRHLLQLSRHNATKLCKLNLRLGGLILLPLSLPPKGQSIRLLASLSGGSSIGELHLKSGLWKIFAEEVYVQLKIIFLVYNTSDCSLSAHNR